MKIRYLVALSVMLTAVDCTAYTISWAWTNNNAQLVLTATSGLQMTCTLTMPDGDKFYTEATMCTNTDYYAAFKYRRANAGHFAVIDKTNEKVNGASFLIVGTDG